jgi:hypothetical protein
MQLCVHYELSINESTRFVQNTARYGRQENPG